LCFFQHDAVWLEQGVNIPGGAARVVGEGHGRAAEDVAIRYHAPLGQSVPEQAESIFDALAAKQGRGFAHAASIS
jgi:hypothetical protein